MDIKKLYNDKLAQYGENDFRSLNWGCAFIMFEKIRASDARFQDIFSITYNDFKLKNKFSPSEIIYK